MKLAANGWRVGRLEDLLNDMTAPELYSDVEGSMETAQVGALPQEETAKFMIMVIDRTTWGWDGYVLASSGVLAGEEINTLGRDLGQFHFPEIPGRGLWIWTGRVISSFSDGEQNDLEFIEGSYRRPTVAELTLIAENQLWRD